MPRYARRVHGSIRNARPTPDPATDRSWDDPDVADLDPRRAKLIRVVLFALFLVAGLAYLSWRTTTFNASAPGYSLAFFAAEAVAFVLTILRLSLSVRTRNPRPVPPAPSGLSVDVFVPCYREDVEIIRRTIVGALAIRYRHETWLLDDGHRSELRALAEELGCRYLTRERNTGAKAGNLDHALLQSTSDFVAVFDADHVASPDFLDRVLGYFSDPQVAIVQCPQDFYNAGSFQHDSAERSPWLHEQSVFYMVHQVVRDNFDGASCCGCAMVARRAALDTVGAFPTATVTEDMHVSVRLMKKGWKMRYHPEALAFGVGATDLSEFIRQRLRWGTGNMQVSREEGLPFSRALGLVGNLSFFHLSVTYLDALVRCIVVASPVVLIAAAVPPLVSKPSTFAAFFVPYFLFTTLADHEHGRGYAPFLFSERRSMARLLVGFGLIAGLFRRTVPFRSSFKGSRRPAFWQPAAPQILVLVSSAIAVVWGSVDLVRGRYVFDGEAEIIMLIVGLAAYNASIAGLVLVDAIGAVGRHGGIAQRTIPLPVTLHLSGGPRLVRAQSIGVHEMTLSDAPPLSEGAVISVELHLPAGPCRVEAEVASSQSGLCRLSFRWPSACTRDRLDQALHAGSWYRGISSEPRRRQTLSERTGLLRTKANRSKWQLGIIGIGPDLPSRLAAIDRTGTLMLAFEKVRPGDTVSFWAPGAEPRLRRVRPGVDMNIRTLFGPGLPVGTAIFALEMVELGAASTSGTAV